MGITDEKDSTDYKKDSSKIAPIDKAHILAQEQKEVLKMVGEL